MSEATETHHGARFVAADDMILADLRRRGPAYLFEPCTRAFILGAMAERGGDFVDVGASTGWFTCQVALAGHPVHAFEPEPAVRARLLQNIALNGVGARVRVYGLAASRRRGRATLWRNPAVPLTSGASIEVATCARPVPVEVETDTLENRLSPPDSRPVSVIKIDVEGHELAVLDGARGLIRRWRPHLVLEANTDRHEADLRGWLAPLGYRVDNADGRNILCAP